MKAQAGFSLVELMCVLAIVSLMASMAWPAVVGLVSGNRLTNNAYQLSEVVQEARTVALAQHTYVWVGFYASATPQGAATVTVATFSGNSGLSNDLQSGNYRMASKPMTLTNVTIAAAASYTSPALPGVDVTDNTDAGTQSYAFTTAIPGHASAQLTDLIAFGPDGQASLPQTSTGTLQPIQCVGLGLNASPSKSLHTVAIQVRGLSGQVSVFQQ